MAAMGRSDDRFMGPSAFRRSPATGSVSPAGEPALSARPTPACTRLLHEPRAAASGPVDRRPQRAMLRGSNEHPLADRKFSRPRAGHRAGPVLHSGAPGPIKTADSLI